MTKVRAQILRCYQKLADSGLTADRLFWLTGQSTVIQICIGKGS
jgi:hypothetical protein